MKNIYGYIDDKDQMLLLSYSFSKTNVLYIRETISLP